MKEKKNIVVLGAGFGGTYTLKHLHKLLHRNNEIQLTLVNNTNYFLFTPLLHEVATGSIKPSNVVEPIRDIFPCCVTNVTLGTITNILPQQQVIETTSGTIPFDYLVIALGSQPKFFNIAGAKEHSYTLKSLDDAITLKKRYITLIEQATHIADPEERRALLQVVIVGGGPTGVELAAETAELFFGTFSKYYPKHIINEVHITLIQSGPELLPAFHPYIRNKAIATLKRKGVTVRLHTSVTAVTPNTVTLSTKEQLPTHTTVWVAGIEATQVPIAGITPYKNNCIRVEPTLQIPNHPNIFVIGDMAYCEDPITQQPLPALAQTAVAQSAVVAKNIVALLNGQQPQAAHIRLKGFLVSLGQWYAAAEIGQFHLTGRFAWWLWRTIYLSKLLSWRKKFHVALDWTIGLFTTRDISDV